ncbi:MAG: LysR family transcriptional regulator [Caldimonas sp.]
MNASLQVSPLSGDDLAMILALTRAPTLAEAATRLGVDASTVFRALQRVEKRLGKRLFERSRGGYRAGELALQLIVHAERIEAELEAARSQLAAGDDRVSGRVRITTTDTVLYGLVMPVLDELITRHPHLQLELDMSYELASLGRRDADIALRATRKPPEHLVGRRLGAVRVAVYAHPRLARRVSGIEALAALPWAVPDSALPEHPSVRWRRRHLPKVVPRLELHGVLAVMEAVAAGLAIGIVPVFLARTYAEVVALTPPLDEAETDLWMLAHPESRYLRRISVVAQALAERIRLNEDAVA